MDFSFAISNITSAEYCTHVQTYTTFHDITIWALFTEHWIIIFLVDPDGGRDTGTHLLIKGVVNHRSVRKLHLWIDKGLD